MIEVSETCHGKKVPGSMGECQFCKVKRSCYSAYRNRIRREAEKENQSGDIILFDKI